MESWADYRRTFAAALDGLAAGAPDGAPIGLSDALDRWVEITREVHAAGRAIYFAGNGASAMMASHMAADACKNGGLRALAFNDVAMVTATGNDVGFDQLFSLPLNRLATRGDLLITISSSGNSPNILRGLDTAHAMGVRAVTLSGKSPDNRSRRMGELNFYVPAQRYGWVESAHQLILHYWFDQYLNKYGQGAI